MAADALHMTETRVIQAALCAWLAARQDARPDAISLTEWRAPEGGGWSNETVLFSVREAGTGAEHCLVLRMMPRGPAMFRDYDLAREYACLTVLGARGRPKVPRVLGADWAGEALGRPFYVMERVEGVVPSDGKPSFMQAGWLFDATPDRQRRFYLDAIEAIAAVHDVDATAPGLETLHRGPVSAGSAVERELLWLRDLFHWGKGERPQPLIEAGFAEALMHLPHAGADVLLWGDARPANTVAREFRIVALLDWELATIGPRELDLFWFLEMNAMRARGAPLPGFLSDADTVAAYEAISGAGVCHEPFYRYVAALKMAVLMLRNVLNAVSAGRLAADHPVLTDNVATRRLATLSGSLYRSAAGPV